MTERSGHAILKSLSGLARTRLIYPFHDRDILVTSCGIWLLSFMHYDLGYIDLEQRTLQTIDNPFGTRV